jgi:hypothetical protein
MSDVGTQAQGAEIDATDLREGFFRLYVIIDLRGQTEIAGAFC